MEKRDCGCSWVDSGEKKMKEEMLFVAVRVTGMGGSNIGVYKYIERKERTWEAGPHAS